MPLTNPAPSFSDRRQSPRVRCGGLARVISLPSEGLTVPGKLLNLSLGGCGIETALPLPPGMRAEFVLHVNTASIRALGEVRASRSANVVGVEFLRVSACGKHLLAELMKELAKQQAIANLRQAARRQSDYERLNQTQSALVRGYSAITANPIRLQPTQARTISIERSVLEAASAPGSSPSVILNGDELDVFI